jgi:hypothetical protein
MLDAMPVNETTYSETPSKIQVKRVRGQELRPKSSEGFGKGMAMEVESLTTSKGSSPKALKGTAKDDFMELARTYKLKAKEAESMARGLSRDTFNAPTLERPTLTKGSLTKRRFEKGGEVKKFEGEGSPQEEKSAGMELQAFKRTLPGSPEVENLQSETLQAINRMDDATIIATADRLTGRTFTSPVMARVALEKMFGNSAVSLGVSGQGDVFPEMVSGYTAGFSTPMLGGRVRGDVEVPRGPGSPMFRLGYQREFNEGGEVQSPEEQPVVEESSASRALKQLVAPVREGIKGYFGMEPETAGSEAYRTGQALSNMPGAGVPATLGIFIGRGAKGWNKAMNDVAKRMTKQGATPEEVWQTTGNFKGPDGMWRQEISDQAARHRGQVSQGPAGMVFEHPELYANYPELKDIFVRTDPYETKSNLIGGGQPGAVINLGTAGGKTENARGMLHELQHDIQFKEGFGQGGSQLMAFKDPRAFEILEEVRAKIAKPVSLEEFARDAWKTDKVTPEIEKGYRTYLDYRKANARDLDIEAQKTAARIYYERLLGEAESRAVESRRLWTPEERRLVLPSQSYRRDGSREIIPLEELIIKKSEGGPVDTSTAKGQLAKLKAA